MGNQTDLGDVTQKETLSLDENQAEETKVAETEKETANEEAGKNAEDTGSGDGNEPEAEAEQPAEIDPETKRVEAQKALDDQESALRESREGLKEDWQDVLASHEQVVNSFKNPIPLNGKPAFLATDEEFRRIQKEIIKSRDPQLLDALDQAIEEREAYKAKCAKLQPKFEKLDAERTKRTLADVEKIKDALVSISPEYKSYFGELEEAIKEEFEANPAKLERFVWGGLRDKYRFIDRVLEQTGIKDRVEKEIRKNDRKNLAAPVGAGTKKSTPTGKTDTTFTRAQIKAMSVSEYEKNEAAITKAMMAGRIK